MFKKNSKENGQYHSNWLNMMMPRLYLAKNLLKQDGVIFVSIDDNEVHNLKLLMNEIFGEENFVANLVWEKRYGRSNDAKLMSTVTEHLLLFRKNESLSTLREPRTEKSNKDYSNPDNDPRGEWTSVSFVSQRTRDERPNLGYSITNPHTGKSFRHPTNSWKYNENKFLEMLADNRFYWGKNNDQEFPRIKRFLSELPDGMVPVNLWKHSDTGTTDEGTKEVVELIGKNIFTFPKPIRLIQRMIQMTTSNGDIILDFFAGSGSTAHAVMDLNKNSISKRKHICIQLPELCDEKGEAFKKGYKTIADVSKKRIRKASEKIEEEIQTEINEITNEIKKLQGELPTEETKAEIESLKTKIEELNNQDLGFKVLKLSDSNFKQWQQITSKDKQALEEQMKLFVDPVAKNATIENMVYELLLKSGKDLNSIIEKKFPSLGGVAESRGGKKRNSINYFNLPYNPKLKERAKELRKAGNLSEVLFWNQVKNKQFNGFDFDRQKIIGNYIVDFYCTNCNVVIEIDGSSHDDKEEYDAERDKFLESIGLTVIHVPVVDVMKNMDGVMQMLNDHPALKGTPPKEGNSEEGKDGYYTINETELVLLLEKANQEIIDAVIAIKPQKVIALDKLFKGNDQLKTNASLQMKDAGIEFKTI